MARKTGYHQTGTIERYMAAVADIIANPGKYTRAEVIQKHGVSAGLMTALKKLGMVQSDKEGRVTATVTSFSSDDAEAVLQMVNDGIRRTPEGPKYTKPNAGSPRRLSPQKPDAWVRSFKMFGRLFTITKLTDKQP